MALLSPQDRQTVLQHLAPISKQVDLLLFTQTFGASDSGRLAKQVLDEVASLHEKISVVEKNFVLDTDDRAKYGVDKSPAIVVLADNVDTRMRLYGAPSGYEFVSLIEAVHLAGTGELDLEPETVAALAALTEPVHLQVFSTPTCPHCPRAVTIAHKLAYANPLVTADAIDAIEFQDLSRKYRVTGVPKTIANDTVEVMGGVPEAEFVAAVLQKADA